MKVIISKSLKLVYVFNTSRLKVYSHTNLYIHTTAWMTGLLNLPESVR